jgi:hypothetical protein
MSHQLGPLDVECDAPCYAVVSACWQIGLTSPADVRWCRLSTYLRQREGLKSLFSFTPWKGLLGKNEVVDNACTCGHALPLLEKCTFTFSTGEVEEYLMGQCPRCRTIFWEEV